MLITIERAALLRALGHVQSVVERRNTIPILSNVLLRADGEALTLTATDMDLEIQESVAATVSRPGATTAPAHTLYDIVRKLPDGSQVELDFGVERGALMLRAGRAQFRLGCLPVEDYPQLNSGELPHRLSLQAAELRTIIDRTRFAISTEETRYYLNGIYLHATPARGDGDRLLRAVATDGHRLARFEMALPEGAESMSGVIVPRKTVGEVRKLIEEAGAPIEVALSETQIRFSIDHIVLTSKLIDGTFPDYERVIPSGNDKVLTVDTKVFAAAVDRVATISTEKSRAVKLSLARGSLTVSASNPEAGSASEELEVNYDSTPIDIGFNSRYLLDIAGQITGTEIQLNLADAASPTIVQDAADSSALYVLMPMRV